MSGQRSISVLDFENIFNNLFILFNVLQLNPLSRSYLRKLIDSKLCPDLIPHSKNALKGRLEIVQELSLDRLKNNDVWEDFYFDLYFVLLATCSIHGPSPHGHKSQSVEYSSGV